MVETAHVVACGDGSRVTQLSTPELGERNVVLFEWLSGEMPEPEGKDLLRGVPHPRRDLGRGCTATRGSGGGRRRFARFSWDYDATLGASGHWGRWQDGLGMGGEELDVLGRLDARDPRAGSRPTAGSPSGSAWCTPTSGSPTSWSTAHTCVIDFDDCGFSWFMYDFATTRVVLRGPPPGARAEGRVGATATAPSRPLDPADEAELDTFVMLRRLLLVAWIGSHHQFATEAAELGAGFTDGSCALAEQYLSNQ